MAAFFVGQRVRLVGQWEHPDLPLPCSTGRIVGAEARSDRTGRAYDWEVLVDQCGWIVVADSHELEPIVPDGMQPVEWSECLWQPEGVTA